MRTSILEFPMKHIEDNLVFARDETVWAYYRIEGFGYDFLDFDDKIKPFQRQLGFLSNNGHDLHFLIDPTPMNVSGIMNQTKQELERLDYPLKDNGIHLMQQVEDELNQQRSRNESGEYVHYLGVQLDPAKNSIQSLNVGNSAIYQLKNFLQGLSSPVYHAVGLDSYDIPKEVIRAYQEQAESLIVNMVNGFSSMVKPATSAEIIYLAEKTYSVSPTHQDVTYRKGFTSGYPVEGMDYKENKHEAVRPKEKAFVDLQNANIEEVGPKTLLSSKIIDNEVEDLYSQYVICSNMDDMSMHPGFEWLYHIQARMPFPIGISIRANYQSNKFIRKKLSNARLEFKDQRQEAAKGEEAVDLSVNESEQGAIQMENYFKQTGQPGYSCSFVFKVSAKDKKTLNTRVEQLTNELSRFGISVLPPYGEQLNLMMETIPGSKSFNKDYQMHVSPSVLAGMMFGATTNIGDNRGFYIGYTKQFHKPVFIKPDLAAKAYENLNNVFDSISVLVAGMTGKGKSFFMNLFVYLATLTGSQGLIIDPKGDRKDWKNGLPYIPKDYISVWEMGTDERDAGSLDPFRTSTNIEEGKDICMDILSHLVNVNIDDDAYTLLSEAIEAVAKQDDPCIGAVITYLQNIYEEQHEHMTSVRHTSVERLKSTLETLRRNQLAKLLFGEVGQEYKVLKTGVPIQVLMVQNLNLPSGSAKKLRPQHKISEAIMISLTAFTKQYMFNQDRMKHKFILQDEASVIERSAVGAELMDFIVRMGRYYNTTLIKGSQNASDHGKEVANMGMKFSFGLRKTEEAKEMLNYFNLPQTQENIDILKNLERGDALFQDIFGRSAVIHVDAIFRDLIEAFDSSTATEEERKRELMQTS
ncbi:ATP-binding protein [Virgibacillus sediminis]|uniref:ATP-binding protein n=1 Tax=Virgibacillus sediminis TaxID=202260 RepID=A0ABV7A3R7_9BACI